MDNRFLLTLPPSSCSSTCTGVSSELSTTVASSTPAATTAATTTTATTPPSTSVTTAAAGGSVVSVGTPPATSASAPTTEAATISKRVLVSNGLKPSGNLLVSFTEKFDEITDDILVAAVEEGGGYTSVTSTTGTTDTMNVIIDVGGKVIVDDVGDIRDVEATSSNSGCNHDGSVTLTEGLESRFTLPLGSIAVNRRSRVIVGDEVVTEDIGHPLGLNEHKS